MAVGRLDRTVELWAWQDGVRLAAFPAHCGFVAAVLFLNAGCQLLTAGEDGKVSLHKAHGGFLGGSNEDRVYLGEGRGLCQGDWSNLDGGSYRERGVAYAWAGLMEGLYWGDCISGGKYQVVEVEYP